MKRVMPIIIILLAITMISCFVIGGLMFASSGNISETLEDIFSYGDVSNVYNETVSINNIKNLKIKSVFSEIVVKKDSSDSLKATLSVGEHNDRYGGIKVDKNSDTVSLTVDQRKSFFNFFNFSFGRRSLEITLPESFNGNITIESVSGSIKAGDIKGINLKLNTVSGSIESERIVGTESVNINSVSGSVNVSDLSGKTDIKTTSGQVTVNRYDLLNDFDMSSVSGGLNLYVVKDVPFSVNLKSLSGMKEAPSDVAGSGVKINAHTTSGSIIIKYIQ